MRRIVGAVCMLMLAGAPSLAQNNPSKLTSGGAWPSRVGVWKLNVAKSQWADQTKAEKSVTLKVTRGDDKGIAWTATGIDASGKVFHESYSGPNDEKDHPMMEGGVATAAYTSTGDEVIGTFKDAKGQVVANNHSWISSDGNTMTIKVFTRDKSGTEVLWKTMVLEKEPFKGFRSKSK